MLIDGALQYFERIIVYFLIIMMAVVILLATGQLGWPIEQDVVTSPLLLLAIDELLDIFGFFLWSQHNATLGHFLKTSSMPLTDCLWLLALGAIPLLVLEMVKVIFRETSARRRRASWLTGAP
jgi:hypothetical protein